MAYQVRLTKQAQKNLDQIDIKVAKLIAAFIEKNLNGCENPRNTPGIKKLQGIQDGYRWRVGNYRILGTIKDQIITIQIFAIGHRRDVYQNLESKAPR